MSARHAPTPEQRESYRVQAQAALQEAIRLNATVAEAAAFEPDLDELRRQ